MRSVRALGRLVVHEARLVWRYGIVAAIGCVTAVWIVALAQVPAGPRLAAAAWVVLIDSAIVGLFFVGALVLFERDEATLDTLAVAPVTDGVRITARVVVLTGLALTASLVVVVPAWMTTRTAGSSLAAVLAPLLVGVALLSALATLNAIIIASPFRAFTDYVTVAPLGLLPLSTPLVLRALGADTAWLQVLPGYGPVDLILAAAQQRPPARLGLSAATGLAWTAVMAAGALAAHRRWLRSAPAPPLGLALRRSAAERLEDAAVTAGPTRTGDAGTGGIRSGARHHHGILTPAGRLLRHDVKMLRRDPMTALLLASPVLLTAVVAGGIGPFVDAVAGIGIDAAIVHAVAVAVVGIEVPALLGGSAVALLLLGDRDDATLLALRATPLTVDGYVAYRGVVAGLFAAVTSAGVLVAARAPAAALAAVPVVAGAGAVTAWTVAAVAHNKVEGLAMVKVMSALWLLPAASLITLHDAAAPRSILVVLALVPTWWPVQVLADALAGASLLPGLVAASAATAVLVAASWRLATRRLVR